jgi:hypothetical protein
MSFGQTAPEAMRRKELSSNDSKDPAEQRREKLQALRERREQVGRRAPAEGAGAAPLGGQPGPGARRFGGGVGAGGAGGENASRRAQIMQTLKNNPEKRQELMERYPQLREAMEKRRQGGGGPPAGAGGGPARFAGGGRSGEMPRGPMAPQPQPPARPSIPAPDQSALSEQVKALERRVTELGDSLKKTREELEESRRDRVMPAVAAPAAAAAAAPAAAAPARPAAAAASASNTDSKGRSAAAKTKLAGLKKASPKK